MLELIASIIMSFIATNIDDIFINTIFFAQVNTKKHIYPIILGKYLGIGTLVIISILASFGLDFISEKYIKTLGFIPIILGIKEFINYFKSKNKSDANNFEKDIFYSKNLLLNVSLITIANGADNIGVYIPLFASYNYIEIILVMIIFSILIGLWCILSMKLANLPKLKSLLLNYKDILVPSILVALGIYILVR